MEHISRANHARGVDAGVRVAAKVIAQRAIDVGHGVGSFPA
jgi:hypothetical protein